MPPTPNRDLFTKVRAFLKYSWIVVGLAVLYTGWIFFARWQQNRGLEEKAAAEKRAQAERVVEAFGGNRFDILNFYASPGVISRGDTAELCYGVSNAKSVRLHPPPKSGVWPALSRCVPVSPQKTTTYTLTAEDAAGNTKAATLTVEVR